MTLTYPTGELVQKGDRIRYGGSEGVVEFIAFDDDPETDWYAERFGGGCMIHTEAFGSIFLRSTDDKEDLELLSRAAE